MRKRVGECRVFKTTAGEDKVLSATAPSFVTMRLSNAMQYERPHVWLTSSCTLRIDEGLLIDALSRVAQLY